MIVLAMAPLIVRQVRTYTIESLPRKPGFQFVGITAHGGELPCTVADDGAFHADSFEVVRLVGWRP